MSKQIKNCIWLMAVLSIVLAACATGHSPVRSRSGHPNGGWDTDGGNGYTRADPKPL